MPEPNGDTALIRALYPLAGQAARILAFLSAYPTLLSSSDSKLAARVSLVSAEHVPVVRRALIENNLPGRRAFLQGLR